MYKTSQVKHIAKSIDIKFTRRTLCQQEAVEKNHQSVNWNEYFLGIQQQCPWSVTAWAKGKIDIQPWRGHVLPLDVYRARIYTVKNINRRRLKKLANKLDLADTENEWLWSHPCYGPYATPIPCLIQQNRQVLTEIRSKLQGLSK
jgi:hypothetical protein